LRKILVTNRSERPVSWL